MITNQYDKLKENIDAVKYRVNEAIYKYNRKKEDVSIMAVTKTVEPAFVNFAMDNSIKLLGENRVQEFLGKYDEYNKEDATIHFIGNLQNNKVKYIIDKVDMIESVSSIKLAATIDAALKKENKKLPVLLQVNIADEETKSGFSKKELLNSLSQLSEYQNIRVNGLMCIPPVKDYQEFFLQTRQLFIDIGAKKLDNINMGILSMGMSMDFEDAIKCGSNIIRLGSALFGQRI